ncbi:MAG TPA: FkbM family methyltransferase [Rhodobacteraceae bacterium]|nr:FkbM family methyltransferase [Paracoccaceae bacterium]
MQAPRKHPLRGLRRLWHRAVGTKLLRHYGVLVPTDPALVPKTVRNGVFTGQYEAVEAEMVRASVKPGDRVMEVGTGSGFVSVLAAKIVGAENVTSFEANPAMEPLIRRTYEANGIAPTLKMKAVTLNGAPLTFFAADNLVSSSKFDRQLEGREVSVESVAFQETLKALKPSVIIMDVEGAEIELLTGVDLAGVTRIIVETHPQITGEASVDALLAHLNAQGFETRAHLQKNALLVREG